METESVLLFRVPLDASSRHRVESDLFSTALLIRQFGGKAWLGWTEADWLKLRVQATPVERTRKAVADALENLPEPLRSSVAVREEQEVAPTPLPAVDTGDVPWGTVLHEKLTKRFLGLLPEGCYVLSNCYGGAEQIFSERIGPPNAREVAWRRAKIAGANGRLCRVVWTETDFNAAAPPT